MNNKIIEKNKIENMIYEIRGVQVMLSSDVAKLYCVETRRINEVIKRNIKRFPNSFCFQLTNIEVDELCLRSQFATLNKNNNLRGQHYKYLPYVLTEQGIMMLSGLLKSDIAVSVNIQIINAFVKMKKYISNNLLEQKYIKDIVLEDHEEIIKLKKLLSKFKAKNNEIYYSGQIYDAYSKILDIFSEAKKELIIVDAYADKSVLDIISKLKIEVILVVKTKSLLSNMDIEKYNKQYNNLTIIYNDTFHDRYFILDKDKVYHCGTSLNHIGNKTFSINILEDKELKENFIKKVANFFK